VSSQALKAAESNERDTQRPVVAFAVARGAAFARDLHETFVQTQIVSDAVLPAFLVLLEVRKSLHDETVYFREG